MKTLTLILFLASIATGAFAQGTISFVNNNAMLISADGAPLPAGTPGSFWLTVLTASPNTTDWSVFIPTGVYATNQSSAGRIFGGFGITVPNWPAGVNRAFYVAIWTADLGTTFNPRWLTGDFGLAGPSSIFGVSPIVPSAAAGGVTPEGAVLPPLNIFGGTYGLQSGFNIARIPEPTTIGVAVLGATVMSLLRRRRK